MDLGRYLSIVCGTGTCQFSGVPFQTGNGIMVSFSQFPEFHGIVGILSEIGGITGPILEIILYTYKKYRMFFVLSRIMAQIFIRFVEIWP